MATKKRIAALDDIIANAQYWAHMKALAANRDADRVRPAHKYGVQRLPNGAYVVTDGQVLVLFWDEIPQLPLDETYDLSNDYFFRLLCKNIEGDYRMVKEPFDGQVKLSAIRNLLKENCTKHPKQADKRKYIYLRTDADNNGKQIEGCFNVLNVRRAVEAVGGKPILYLGYGKRSENEMMPFPCLLVEQEDSMFRLESGAHALVMPVRIS